MELEQWRFCDNKEDADKLFMLVKIGIKTATSSLFINQTLATNTKSILTNWDNTEQLLLMTTNVYITRFNQVTENHAFKEGENDRSLTSWKVVHKEFFTKECKKHNMTFNDDTKIICEEFEVVKE